MLLAAHESRKEILGSQSDLRRRRWHPAKLRECSVSPALSCISFRKPLRDLSHFTRESSSRDRAKGSAGTFQRGKIFGTLLNFLNCTSPETHFSTGLPQVSAQLLRNLRHTTS